jgi:hypothetical protein
MKSRRRLFYPHQMVLTCFLFLVTLFTTIKDVTTTLISPTSLIISASGVSPCLIDITTRTCRSIGLDTIESGGSLLADTTAYVSLGRTFIRRTNSRLEPMRSVPLGSDINIIDNSVLYTMAGEIGLVDIDGSLLWSVEGLSDPFPRLSEKRYLGKSGNSIFFCLDTGSESFLLSLDKTNGTEVATRDIPACDASGSVVFDGGISYWNSTNVSVWPLSDEVTPVISRVDLPDDQETPIVWRNGVDDVSLVFSPELIFESKIGEEPVRSIVEEGGERSGGRGLDYNGAVIGFSIMAFAILLLLFGIFWVVARRTRGKRDFKKEARLTDPGALSTRPSMLDDVETGGEVRRMQSSLSTVMNENGEARDVEVSYPLEDVTSMRGELHERRNTVVLLTRLEGEEEKDEASSGSVKDEKKEGLITKVFGASLASSSDASYHTAKSSLAGSLQEDEADDASIYSVKSQSTIKGDS